MSMAFASPDLLPFRRPSSSLRRAPGPRPRGAAQPVGLLVTFTVQVAP
ncbi:hypothetical protein FHS42_002180 [Streptomyces zagrosensis]|uniref:Uncharacterized protein n=1 Tax=Streptomyces zagrosensis TaxID=1042984 RepID=A0A7W9UXQ9_9ACTN|nr:hypothetical protein [Streptomyces zagrosensis]